MKPDLDRLRSETSNVFNEAIDLKMRWSLIEEAQNDAYKVRSINLAPLFPQ